MSAAHLSRGWAWRALALLALLIGGWELYVDLGGADPLLLPSPHAIAQVMYEQRGLLWRNFLVTAEETLLGIALATLAGLALALLIHLSRTARSAVYPLLVASQTIPIPLIAPLLVFWLGFGILPKLVVIALVSFFPIVVATTASLAAVDPALLKLMRTFDASRARTLRHVELPAALPGVFTGAKIAIVVAVIGAVFAEQAGADAGLGYLFQQSLPSLDTALGYAAVIVLSLFAIALFGLLSLGERLALPWAHGESAR